MVIVGENCRKARHTLLEYRLQNGLPLNIDGCFDHALACYHCHVWAGKNGFIPMLKKYTEDKLKEFSCPACGEPMKVNLSFQAAKCLQCGFGICWTNALTITAGIVNLAEILAKRRGLKLGSLPIPT